MTSRILDQDEAKGVLAIYEIAADLNMDCSIDCVSGGVSFLSGGAVEIECAHSDESESFEDSDAFRAHYDLTEADALAHYEAMARDAKAGAA